MVAEDTWEKKKLGRETIGEVGKRTVKKRKREENGKPEDELCSLERKGYENEKTQCRK